MKTWLVVFISILIFPLASCIQGPESPAGFSLPKGDINNGRLVFLQYKCLSCHELKGVDDNSIEFQLKERVVLGGEAPKVKTYAELVTSIINPSHKLPLGYRKQNVAPDGMSKMTVFNDIMTISELVDLVAFLQPHYEVKPEQYTHYNIYHIP